MNTFLENTCSAKGMSHGRHPEVDGSSSELTGRPGENEQLVTPGEEDWEADEGGINVVLVDAS